MNYTVIAKTVDVSLKDVLIFATGSEDIPPMGFVNRPLIEFKDQQLPTASTCGPLLVLPLHVDNEKTFIEKMCFGIKDCCGFGQYFIKRKTF